MTFAWSKWAGAAPSLWELPASCQLDGRIPVTQRHRGTGQGSLGHVDMVVFPAWLPMAPVHHGAVLCCLAQIRRPRALCRATLAPACSGDALSAVVAVRVQCDGMTDAGGTWWWLSPCTGQKAG